MSPLLSQECPDREISHLFLRKIFQNQSNSSHDPQISPNSGPLEGGTTITVMGSNLGVTQSDIVEVTINDVSCDVNGQSYLPGVRYIMYGRIQGFIQGGGWESGNIPLA